MPLGSKVVLKLLEEKKTKSGILIEGDTGESVRRGEIVAGSMDTCPSCKTVYYPSYGVGTVVLFPKHAGDVITLDKVLYILIDTNAILAIVQPDAEDAPAEETAS